MAIMSKISNTR